MERKKKTAGTIFDNAVNVGVGTVTPACQLAVSGTQSLSGIATVGSFQIGENNTQNLVMDNNEVFSRFNGGASTLFLQYWGGDMSVCAGGGTTSFNGPINGQSASFGSDLLGYGNTVIDAGGNNIGSLNYGLTFGNASGEGISSKRDAGGNQFGLDFYTASANRMNISNAGLVNIVNDKTAQATTSANLQITSASAAPFYPAIGFSYLGDGNEIYSTTSAGGILVVKYDGSSYSPVTASAFNTVPAAASTTRNMQTIANTDFSTYLDQIRNVESVTYNNKNETAAMRSFPHIGFNAESLPGTIKSQVPVDGKVNAETTTGYNLTDLAGLTLIGVKAVDAKTQELEKQVNELKASVKDLENALASCCSNYSATRNGVDNSSATDKASLEQNNPNPFSSQTAIHYYLPSNSTAVLKVMSLEGQEMLSSTITKTGYGEVTISGSSLAAGTYTYTLLVNGKAVESKIMVLTK